MDSSRVIIVAKEGHQCHQGHRFYKITISLAVPSATLWSNITHVISYWYTNLPARHQLFRLSIRYRSQSSPTAQRIVAESGPGAFLPSFTIYSSKFLSLPCFHAFPLDCPGYRARDAPFCPQSKGNTSFRDDEVMLPACPFHLILLAVDDCLTASLSPPSYCRSWCVACVVDRKSVV